MKITSITRRDILDSLVAENVSWNGRLEEPEFLSRLFDLSALPSTDNRFKDAAGDIWQHRVNNPEDWPDDWVFSDNRFSLANGDDETFLRFLCEMVHPVVRPDAPAAQRIVQMLNAILIQDGFQLAERTRISGKPIYVGRFVGVGVEHSSSADVPELVELTAKCLELTPHDIPETAKANETIKRLLSNLGTITQGLAELRNHYGTGHGKIAGTKGLSPRHAKLAVGAASTLAVFLAETHNERPVNLTKTKER